MTMPPSRQELVTVAIAICTFDRATLLRPLLETLGAPCSEGITVYVINNGPGEETLRVAKAFGTSYLRETTPGLSHARNAAVAATSEDYVHFLDDDVVPPERFAETLRDVLCDQYPQVLGAPVYPHFPDAPPSHWMPEEFFVRRRAREGWNAVGSVSGGSFSVRRDVLDAIGGFDIRLGMQGKKKGFLEEMEFLLRWRLAENRVLPGLFFTEACAVAHYEPAYKTRLGYLLRRNWMSHRQRGGLMSALAGPRAHLYRRSLSVNIAIGLWATVRSPFYRRGRRRAIARALVSLAGRLGEWIGAHGPFLQVSLLPQAAPLPRKELRVRRVAEIYESDADPLRCHRVIVDGPIGLAEAVEFIRSYPLTELSQGPRRRGCSAKTFILATLGLVHYR